MVMHQSTNPLQCDEIPHAGGTAEHDLVAELRLLGHSVHAPIRSHTRFERREGDLALVTDVGREDGVDGAIGSWRLGWLHRCDLAPELVELRQEIRVLPLQRFALLFRGIGTFAFGGEGGSRTGEGGGGGGQGGLRGG